jgi:hypothetical protein
VRWIVLLIATISLLGGACTSGEVQCTDPPASVVLKQTTSLPAAIASARRVHSVSELRLPTFTIPSAGKTEPLRAAVVEPHTLDPRGHRWVRASHVAARGPPRT